MGYVGTCLLTSLCFSCPLPDPAAGDLAIPLLIVLHLRSIDRSYQCEWRTKVYVISMFLVSS